MAVDGIGTVVSVLSGRVRTNSVSVVCFFHFLGPRGPPIEPLIPSATIFLLVVPRQPGCCCRRRRASDYPDGLVFCK